MSISYNKVILVGRTTKAPELKMGANMTEVVNFTLAVDRGYGEVKGTDFFNCVAFGKTAGTMARYAEKGSLLLVEGRLEIDKWTDKNYGVTKERAKIVVNNFKFLETKKSKGDSLEEDVESMDDEFEKLLNEEYPND